MALDINLNVTNSPSNDAPVWAEKLLQMVEQISQQIGIVLAKEDQIMSAQTDALDQAEAAAAANSAADDSAEALLLTLVQLYQDAVANSTDPAVTARVVALGEQITARAAKLSAKLRKQIAKRAAAQRWKNREL